jgi:hypothetical protein
MKELSYINRCLRTRTGKRLFGPVGKRAWVSWLEPVPGFAGRIDFIHKTNLIELFTVLPEGIPEPDWALTGTVWHPYDLTLSFANEDFAVEETKLLLDSDTAVSLQKWTNLTEKPLRLRFACHPEKAQVKAGDGYFFKAELPLYGYTVGGYAVWDAGSEADPFSTVLQPGETKCLQAFCQLGNLSQETEDSIRAKLADIRRICLEPQDYCGRARQEWADFAGRGTQFTSSSEIYNQTWQYRNYILKSCLADPRFGNFSHPVMYEGRSHKMGDAPLESQGWEFSKLIPLSTPLHVMDLRWKDPELAKEILRTFYGSADKDGIPVCMTTSSKTVSYSNFGVWAVWQLYLTDGDKEFLREMLPAMKAFVEGHCRIFGDPTDTLQIEYTHARTGKEYQPSYWAFAPYPKDPRDKTAYTPLKRVDRSVYHYLNVKGLAACCRTLGDADAKRYSSLAERIAEDINKKMYDPQTAFYYDLHYQTDEKAMVKNIVGIYPWWAGIGAENGIETLLDPEEFASASGYPSVSKKCEVYAPDGGWQNLFFKGRNGCVWDGPSWPYTTGIALAALGNESLRSGHRYDAEFVKVLRQYAAEHFRDGDPAKPYLVEHYNPESGEPLSDELDYNHSFWMDLIVTYAAGVQLTEDRIRFEPLRLGFRRLEVTGLRIRGHVYDVLWSEKDGYRILQDGRTLHASGQQEPYEIIDGKG